MTLPIMRVYSGPDGYWVLFNNTREALLIDRVGATWAEPPSSLPGELISFGDLPIEVQHEVFARARDMLA